MLKRCSYASYQPAFMFDQQATKKSDAWTEQFGPSFLPGPILMELQKGVTACYSSNFFLLALLESLQFCLATTPQSAQLPPQVWGQAWPQGWNYGCVNLDFLWICSISTLGEITQQIPTMSDESHESHEYWEMNRRPRFGHCIVHSSSSCRDTSRTCCQAVRRCPWDCKTNILPRKT